MADGFVFCTIDIVRDKRLSKMQIRVLLALFSFRANNTDIVWPKRSTICEIVGYSDNVISRVTNQLVGLGWLKKEGEGGRSSPAKYMIIVPDFGNFEGDSEQETLTDSVSKTLTDSVRGKELTRELTNTTTTTAKKTDFEMSLDWQPTEKDLKLILLRAGGFDFKKIKSDWLVEFVSHWASVSRKHNQAKWTAKFALKAIGYFRNPNLFNSQQGIRASPAKKQFALGDAMPSDDSQLVSWMRKNGLGDPLPGMNFDQARAYARRALSMKKGEVYCD